VPKKLSNNQVTVIKEPSSQIQESSQLQEFVTGSQLQDITLVDELEIEAPQRINTFERRKGYQGHKGRVNGKPSDVTRSSDSNIP